MTKSYLSIELRLLLMRYGRPAVVSTLATLEHSSIEEIEQELDALRSVRQPHRRHKRADSGRVTADKLVAERPDLRKLASLYSTKMFLPSLRDVRDFLSSHGTPMTVKSRTAAYANVIAALSTLPSDQLASLERSSASSRDPGAFSLLAGELMNPSRNR